MPGLQPFVRRYLAECHAAIGDLAAADSEYKHAIELAGPLDTDVRLGYANMLLRVGQEVRQLQQPRRCLVCPHQLNPRCCDTLAVQRRALAAYDEVLDILTGHGVQVQDAWLGKARAFSRLGNAGEAEEAFKSSLQEDEDGVDGMAGEAGAWRRRGAMEAHAALAALAMTDGRAHEAVLRYTEAVEATQQEIAACGSEGSPEGADELGYTVRTLRCHRAAALLAVADYDGALQDCDAVLRERVAANADALLVAFITRAQCRTALGEWGRATEDFTAYLDATRQADAESSLDPSPEAAARRRQRAQVLLKRSEALVGTALALPVSDANRSELQSLYTAALMDLEHCEATCTDLDMVAAAAEMRKSIRGDESDIVRKGR
jgi:tetratricopeptide (TPR) repeat protein